MKHQRRFIFPAPWPAIWAWVFLSIVVLGLAMPTSFILTVIKIGGIFLCLVYVIQIAPQDRLLQSALLLTFIADIILAINNTAEIGVLIFIIVQILHHIRLEGKNYLLQILSFTFLTIVAIIVNLIWVIIPMIYLLVGFYIVALFTNIYVSWRWWRQHPKNPQAIFALIGFMLFLCCDASTGTSYLALNHMLPAFCYGPSNFLAWFFYYPAQIFISNSSKYDKMK